MERATDYRSPADKVYVDHRGEPRPGAVYWVPPDAAIGEVVSAASNQSEDGYAPVPTKMKVVGGLLGLFVGGVLAFLLGSGALWLAGLPNRGPEHVPELFVYAFFFLALLPVFRWLAKRRPQCSYIGTEGVAEHTRHAFGEQHFVMRFEDADSLTTSEVARYRNGVYQGTDFRFTWRDKTGGKCLELAGMRFDRGVMKQDSPAWAFTEAAERAWFPIRHRRAVRDLKKHGHAVFEMGKGRTLTVTRDALVLSGVRGGRETLPFDEVESLRCDQGTLILGRVGAKQGWLRSEGITRYLVAEVRDLAVLLQLVRDHTTIRM